MLVEKYYGSPKSEYILNYDPQIINVAIHIRRGDVKSDNQFWEKFTDNGYILRVLQKVLNIIASHGIETIVCVYSEGEGKDFKELQNLNARFFLNEDPFTTFNNLVCADVLILSKSTFSYTAGLLSNGIVFYEPFWHRPQANWIKVKESAKFNPKEFSRKLAGYLSERQCLNNGAAKIVDAEDPYRE